MHTEWQKIDEDNEDAAAAIAAATSVADEHIRVSAQSMRFSSTKVKFIDII